MSKSIEKVVVDNKMRSSVVDKTVESQKDETGNRTELGQIDQKSTFETQSQV